MSADANAGLPPVLSAPELMSFASPATIAGPVTVSVLLGKLSDLVQQAIEAARNAGVTLEIEAGKQINIAIENAKNAYADLLQKTVAEVDNTVKGTLDQLQGIVDDLTQQAIHDLGQLTQTAQQIVNSLPFHKHQPQLTRESPRFVVPAT